MNLLRCLLRTSIAFALAMGMAAAAKAGEPVRLGQIGLSFYAVAAGVVQQVLERLGHEVAVTRGSHAQIFPRLADGEIDLLVAAWLPHAHAVYWQQYGSKAEALTSLYEGARFAWMVPTYVPADLVASIVDLARPEVRARMSPVIQGTGRDSGNMMASEEVMKHYELEVHGYRLQPGTVTDFHAAYDRHIAGNEWFVMPLWWPHYINRIGNMRPLHEPKGLLGAANEGKLVASRAWIERAPARTLAVLRRIELGQDAVAEMDYLVNVDGLSARAAAAAWMEQNEVRVAGWLAQP